MWQQKEGLSTVTELGHHRGPFPRPQGSKAEGVSLFPGTKIMAPFEGEWRLACCPPSPYLLFSAGDRTGMLTRALLMRHTPASLPHLLFPLHWLSSLLRLSTV